MEQSDCLNCFLTKTEVLMDWKRWSKKNLTTQVLCAQCKVNHCPIRQTVPMLSIFFISAFSPPRLQFLFLKNI